MTWTSGSGGVVALPSGLLVRGGRLADGREPADFTLVLGNGPAPSWAHRRLRWPDFWVPLDREHALEAIHDAYARLGSGQRLEVACGGGVGRTGTALAALAVLDGLPPDAAVTWVRARYHPRAVEAPWQRRWLRQVVRFGA